MSTASVRWSTFVMRLWNDSSSGQWRGEIMHLQSKESCYFASWEQAEAFAHRFAPGLPSQGDAPESKTATSPDGG